MRGARNYPHKNIKINQLLAKEIGAQEKTRTSTSLRKLAPEASASTNSATWAGRVGRDLATAQGLVNANNCGNSRPAEMHQTGSRYAFAHT